MIYIKTNLEKMPEACEVCPYGKKYGAVGERFCKILEAYFTGNTQPPYKERPDDCPFCEMQENISAADCGNCICKEVCMYKEDLEKCSKAISNLKIPLDDAGSFAKLEATPFAVGIECPYMARKKGD